MKRPLKNRRLIGPFVDVASDSNDDEADNDVGSNDPILQQAEDWWDAINEEKNKRKMMKNYMGSMTDLDEEEIEQKLDEAGL